MRYIRFFALGLTEFFIAILQAVIGTRNRMVFIGRYIAEKSLTHFSLLKKNGFIGTLYSNTNTHTHTQVQKQCPIGWQSPIGFFGWISESEQKSQ